MTIITGCLYSYDSDLCMIFRQQTEERRSQSLNREIRKLVDFFLYHCFFFSHPVTSLIVSRLSLYFTSKSSFSLSLSLCCLPDWRSAWSCQPRCWLRSRISSRRLRWSSTCSCCPTTGIAILQYNQVCQLSGQSHFTVILEKKVFFLEIL